MFKNINESFEKKFQNISNESLITKLTECLNTLNEAEMSDEDKHDSDLIRSMIDKIQTRSNAKFSPEEKSVMDKYGIERNNQRKKLTVDDRDLNPDLDNNNHLFRYRSSYSNGTPSKINYADRARKLPQRKSSQLGGDGSYWYRQNGELNRHTGYGGQNFNELERDIQNNRTKQPIRDMKRALDDRKRFQNKIDNADSERNYRMSVAKKSYDAAVASANKQYEYDTVDATEYRDRAQGEIDTLLKREPKTESKVVNEAPSYDMTPQYDARQSFYGKARVDDNGNEKTLYSYNTPVVRIVGDSVELLPKWDWSQTTLRHCKEFLKQNGFEASSLAQMRRDYL